MDGTIKNLFREDLTEFKPAPFLFIGSGFSRRYLDLENWKNLLKRFCLEEMKQFEYYLSKSNSELPATASLIVEDFHEVWWGHIDKEEIKDDALNAMTEQSSPLKYEISNYLKNKSLSDVVEEREDEIETFKNVVVDGVITTNWDNLLEEIFPEFDVYVGQEDLLNSVVQEIAEIYKIHGSISEFNSLVLTQEDYENFNDRNPYLAAKLLTIFIEHPIIFLGYSIEDKNVQKILLQMSELLTDTGLGKIKGNLFFVEPILGEEDEEVKYQETMLTIEGQNFPITKIKVQDFTKVYSPLKEYNRKISVKQLSRIKSELYDIVKNNDPNSKIATMGLNDLEENEDIEFVVGIGIKEDFAKYGYVGIEYDDVLEDIVLDNRSFQPEIMVEEALPQILKRTWYTPYYKYLNKGDYLDEEGKLDKEVPDRVEKYLDESGDKFVTRRTKQILESQDGSNEYDYDLDPNKLMADILENGKQSIDLYKLEEFLEDNVEMVQSSQDYDKAGVSDYRKLVRIYDWLKYCHNAEY